MVSVSLFPDFNIGKHLFFFIWYPDVLSIHGSPISPLKITGHNLLDILNIMTKLSICWN